MKQRHKTYGTANQHLSYHRKGALKPPQNRHFSEPSKKRSKLAKISPRYDSPTFLTHFFARSVKIFHTKSAHWKQRRKEKNLPPFFIKVSHKLQNGIFERLSLLEFVKATLTCLFC